jgi:pSer/pThr/pTyr-binding forkhead associated (FHA) protein
MWRVSALDRDGREIGDCELADGELTIGRDTDRLLILPSASVSRRHARLVMDNGQLSIVDEGSSNGVVVDGAKITAPTLVGPTSRIEIAEFRIAVELVKTIERVRKPPAAAQPPTDAPKGAGVRLVAEGGPFDGRVFNLPPGTSTLGRAIDNDLVFDDPSLSRRHASIHRDGGKIEIEDLGSSNGSFVSGRRVGRGAVAPGDVVRFGDLSFRCEGGEHGSTRSVDPGLSRIQLYGLVGGGALTSVLLVLAIVFLVRKTPTVHASGREAIAKLSKQAEGHAQVGKRLYEQRRYADAKAELDEAIELDPANLEARRLARASAHGPEDDRALSSAQAAIAIGDKKGLEQALRAWEAMTDGGAAKATLRDKLEPALARWGDNACGRKEWADCAWALCKAASAASPAEKAPVVARLKDAERKVKRDRSFQPCRAL